MVEISVVLPLRKPLWRRRCPLSATLCPSLAVYSARQEIQGMFNTFLSQIWPLPPAAQLCYWHLTTLQSLLDWKLWLCVSAQHQGKSDTNENKTYSLTLSWKIQLTLTYMLNWQFMMPLCIFSEIDFFHTPIAPHWDFFFNVSQEMYDMLISNIDYSTQTFCQIWFLSWKFLCPCTLNYL